MQAVELGHGERYQLRGCIQFQSAGSLTEKRAREGGKEKERAREGGSEGGRRGEGGRVGGRRVVCTSVEGRGKEGESRREGRKEGRGEEDRRKEEEKSKQWGKKGRHCKLSGSSASQPLTSGIMDCARERSRFSNCFMYLNKAVSEWYLRTGMGQ